MHVTKQIQVTKVTFEKEESMGSLRTAAGLWFRPLSRNRCKPFPLKFSIAVFFQCELKDAKHGQG